MEVNQTYFAKSEDKLLLVAPVVASNWTSKDDFVLVWTGCRCTTEEVTEVTASTCSTFCRDTWTKNFSFAVRLFEEGAYTGPWSGSSEAPNAELFDFQTAIASSSCCIKHSPDSTVLVEWKDGEEYQQQWNQEELDELLFAWFIFTVTWIGTYFIVHMVAAVVFTKVAINNRPTVF